jgi:hypothetical protein
LPVPQSTSTSPGILHARSAIPALLQWAFTYKRATVMQAPLAMISLIAGAAAWLFGASVGWLMGDLLIGAVVSFTFIAIMPAKHKLLTPGRDLAWLKPLGCLNAGANPTQCEVP